MKSINDTLLVLIPKLKKLEFVIQFRLVSLCNVAYKSITKLLVNRLKPYIFSLISLFQSSFIPNKFIHDNVIIVQELIHAMRKMKGRRGFFAIKINLKKTYDCLNWNFIKEVFMDIKMLDHIIKRGMDHITITSFNVLWNGNRTKNFRLSRKIRQGDPLSPYIFVLYMDKLTHIINDAINEQCWIPLRAGKNDLPISHVILPMI